MVICSSEGRTLKNLWLFFFQPSKCRIPWFIWPEPVGNPWCQPCRAETILGCQFGSSHHLSHMKVGRGGCVFSHGHMNEKHPVKILDSKDYRSMFPMDHYRYWNNMTPSTVLWSRLAASSWNFLYSWQVWWYTVPRDVTHHGGSNSKLIEEY